MGLLDTTKRWPQNTVPYEIDVVYSPDDIDLILQAMNAIQSTTCIKFVQRTYETNYIRFQVPRLTDY